MDRLRTCKAGNGEERCGRFTVNERHCLSCGVLAKNLELKGVDTPDYLRLLWRHLYGPIERKYAELQNIERWK
jgi:hypothetical protein